MNWTKENFRMFDLSKFRDFFRYYDDTSPQKREAVKRLYDDLVGHRPELLQDASYWVQAWRKRMEPPATPPGRHITADGLRLIQNSEGLRLKAYQDSVGVWTIGYGHTATAHPGMEITNDQADALLRKDLAWAEDAVTRLVTVPITDGQFSALVSFTFNLGAGALGESTLLRKINAGKFVEAGNEFGKWVFAGGQELPGLVTRRSSERQMFLTASPPMPPSTAGVKASIQGQVRPIAQQTSKSCGLACVAMAINLLGGKHVDDLWVQDHYGYGLLPALNENSGGKKWVDVGNFTASMWPAIRENLLEGCPTIIGLNGPEFSPSGYGHILLIVSVEGNNVGLADPNGGKFRQVSKSLVENCPAHTDGKFVFMVK
jgi:lysozyme